MKKTVFVFFTLLIMCSFCITVYAGSIPEDLLSDTDAKLYIGTVEDFTVGQIQSASQEKIATAVIIPTEKIKGDVEIGKAVSYDKTNIYMDLEKGKQYLIADIDENNIYAYQIESWTNKNIKLTDSDKYDMTQRIEQYINEGVYEMAEKERQSIGNKVSFFDYFGENIQEAQKITFTYNDVTIDVDKNKFFEIAKEIIITNVQNGIVKDSGTGKEFENVLYISAIKDDGSLNEAFAAVTKYGEVDRYGMFMSRMMSADYEMKTEDLEKLYSMLPQGTVEQISVSAEQTDEKDSSGNLDTKIIIICVSVIVAIFIIVFAVRKRK